MKTRLLLGLLFGVLLLTVVSAIPAAGGTWSNGSSSAMITNGSTIGFNYYFVTTCSPMQVSAKLYDSSGNLLYTFFKTSINSSNYYNNVPVELTPQIYKNPGNYHITLHASDSQGQSSYTIYITVNPSLIPPPPTNHAPVITSTPITKVNENSNYNYQVKAYDPDGDNLTYYLITSATWLSISPSTGLITGTAPNVNSNKNYGVQVKVSDGKINASQTYTLTVKNLFVPPTPNDTVPPVITLNFPANNFLTNLNPVTFSARVSDNINLKNVSLFIDGNLARTSSSGINNTNYVFTKSLTEGSHSWYYRACDMSGNCAVSGTRSLTIDTISPLIQFVSPTPTSGSVLNSTQIQVNITASDSGTGLKNITIYLYNSAYNLIKVSGSSSSIATTTFTNLPEGIYYLNATAFDLAGNSQRTSTRTITLNTTSNNNQINNTNSYLPSSYSYYDVYTPQYQEQLNYTSNGVALTEASLTKTSNSDWIWIVGIIVLVILIILLAILIRRRSL